MTQHDSSIGGRSRSSSPPSRAARQRKWERLLLKAEKALEDAKAEIDEVAEWSGSSGNWPLQEASLRVSAACAAMRYRSR